MRSVPTPTKHEKVARPVCNQRVQRQLCVSLKRIILNLIRIPYVSYFISKALSYKKKFHKKNFDIDTKEDYGILKYINGNTRILCLMKRVIKILLLFDFIRNHGNLLMCKNQFDRNIIYRVCGQKFL